MSNNLSGMRAATKKIGISNSLITLFPSLYMPFCIFFSLLSVNCLLSSLLLVCSPFPWDCRGPYVVVAPVMTKLTFYLSSQKWESVTPGPLGSSIPLRAQLSVTPPPGQVHVPPLSSTLGTMFTQGTSHDATKADPITKKLNSLIPVNETRAERTQRLVLEQEARRVSNEIDEKLHQEWVERQHQKIVKILLLGMSSNVYQAICPLQVLTL